MEVGVGDVAHREIVLLPLQDESRTAEQPVRPDTHERGPVLSIGETYDLGVLDQIPVVHVDGGEPSVLHCHGQLRCDRFDAHGHMFADSGEPRYLWVMTQHHHGVSPYEAKYGFSRAVRNGARILVAGTAPVPEPGEQLAKGPYAQMLRCGEIAAEAIHELGGSMSDVVRTRVFITDASAADEVGRAHKELFGVSEPAATMVVVAGLLDPEWFVEIEVEAIVSSA